MAVRTSAPPQGGSRLLEATAHRDRVYRLLHGVLYNFTLATRVFSWMSIHATLREYYPDSHPSCGRTLVGVLQALYLSGGRQAADGAHCDHLLGAWLVATSSLDDRLYLLELPASPAEATVPCWARPHTLLPTLLDKGWREHPRHTSHWITRSTRDALLPKLVDMLSVADGAGNRQAARQIGSVVSAVVSDGLVKLLQKSYDIQFKIRFAFWCMMCLAPALALQHEDTWNAVARLGPLLRRVMRSCDYVHSSPDMECNEPAVLEKLVQCRNADRARWMVSIFPVCAILSPIEYRGTDPGLVAAVIDAPSNPAAQFVLDQFGPTNIVGHHLLSAALEVIATFHLQDPADPTGWTLLKAAAGEPGRLGATTIDMPVTQLVRAVYAASKAVLPDVQLALGSAGLQAMLKAVVEPQGPVPADRGPAQAMWSAVRALTTDPTSPHLAVLLRSLPPKGTVLGISLVLLQGATELSSFWFELRNEIARVHMPKAAPSAAVQGLAREAGTCEYLE